MSQDLIHEPTRGARRAARTRSTPWARIIRLAVIAAIVVAALLIATDTWRLPGAPNGHRYETTSTTTTSTSAIPAQNAAISTGIRAYGSPRSLTYANPMRLWIGGDSLAGSLGPSLGKMEGATGVVKPVFNSRVSSGLNSPNFYNWPRHATSDMSTYKPETAVFIIGANDTGNVVPSRPEAWQPAYREKVNAMLDLLGANGLRFVVWVGAPRLKNSNMDTRVKLINEVAKDEVGKRANAEFVDTYALFSDANGDYAASLPVGTGGKSVRVRTPDGVHFTPDGGDFLAQAVAEVLERMWGGILRQSEAGKSYPAVPVKGSTQIAGTSRDTTVSVVTPISSTTSKSSTTQGTVSSSTSTVSGGSTTSSTTSTGITSSSTTTSVASTPPSSSTTSTATSSSSASASTP